MNVHREASANAISRELALVDRIEMLENRLTNSLEKEEKSSAQCDRLARVFQMEGYISKPDE